MSDSLFDAINSLSNGNSSFDQILYDDVHNVLSFRYCGGWRYVNLWLDATLSDSGDHYCETNGSVNENAKILWEMPKND